MIGKKDQTAAILMVTMLMMAVGFGDQVSAQSTNGSGNGDTGSVNERFRNAGMLVLAGRGTPVIDGVLSAGEWNGAMPYTGFTQFQPDPDTPASQKTTAWILFDEDNLYVAFACEQPEYPIQAYIARRDHLPGDPDYVGILVDPFLSWKEAYLFMVNPAGVQGETMIGSNGGGDGNWDTLWKAKASMHESGWSAEMEIPWNSLRFTRDHEQIWGINLVRSIGENSELSVYAPLDIGGNNLIASNAMFQGIEGVSPGRSIWFNPYATGRIAREGAVGDGADWARQTGLNYMGADLRLGLSSNLMLDLTVNPDFGHIEADQEQINLTPYELFFDEKRPFFQEGQRIFEMPINLFYSRRIYNPIGGAKLTGQVGSTQVGLVTAYNEPLGTDDSFPYAMQSALRLKQNIGTSYIGAMLTSQEIPAQSRTDDESGYQRNIGFDFDFKPSDRISVMGQVATFSEAEVGRRNSAWVLAAAYTSRSLISEISVVDIQRDFDARLGYVPRPNQLLIEPFIGYRHEADWGQIKWVTPNCRIMRFQNSTTGELVEQRIGPGVSVQMRNNSNINFDVWVWDVRRSGTTYPGTNYIISWNANQSGDLSGYAGIDFGDGFDYEDERVVTDFAGWTGVTWRPTMRASVSVSGRFIQRNMVDGGGVIDDYLIGSIRGNYQFTRELFGRLYLQQRLDHTGQDAGAGSKSRRMIMNALLGYEVGPGSVIYLAYNHYDLGTVPGVGEPDRVLFLKVARLFAF
ncbi:DUF5916 domain-containing protein [Gemmatimonadota bacterium]